MYIIMYGKLTEGFTVVGTFKTKRAALHYLVTEPDQDCRLLKAEVLHLDPPVLKGINGALYSNRRRK